MVIALAGALVACSPNAAPAEAVAEQAEAGSAQSEQAQTGLRQVPLTITSANGAHRFTVDVAATPAEQQRGLMFVKSLRPDRGMIFPYEVPQNVAFWMRNTLIPLDIVFIRPNGTIARITHAKPLDETPLPSGEPIAVVLEIAGGRAAELGISEGDKVVW